MSSYQLKVSPEESLSSLVPTATTPIYVSFSAEDDTLGVLWEHGYIELWSLQMRLLPGPGKIMDPTKVWSGFVAKYDKSNAVRYRQLAVKTVDAPRSFVIIALGSRYGSTGDHVSVLTIEDGTVKEELLFGVPRSNSRLLTPAVPDTYETHNGQILTCMLNFQVR